MYGISIRQRRSEEILAASTMFFICSYARSPVSRGWRLQSGVQDGRLAEMLISSIRRWCRAALGAGLLLVASACSSGFDLALWREADPSTRQRAEMVDDLMRAHPLNGLHRAEVMTLLGPPTRTDKWQDWQMVYVLGPKRGFLGIDDEWLLLRLDGSGVVIEHRIETD
jgi:hypothetical protein